LRAAHMERNHGSAALSSSQLGLRTLTRLTALFMVYSRHPNYGVAAMLFNMTDELFDEICERMVNGESVRSICQDDHMPAISTLMKILRTNPNRTSQYALAMQMRADAMFEEVLNIADDGSNDFMLKNADDPTSFALNGEHVQRSRLRVDTRKWALGRMNPKKYGEKTFIGGVDDAPIKVQNTIDVSRLSLEELEMLEKVLSDV